MSSDEADRRIRELEAELARKQAELDRLRDQSASREPAAESVGDKPSLLEGTLFISEVEVRSAIARQLRNGARLLQASKCLYMLYDGVNELVAQRPALGVEEDQLGRFRCTVNRGVSGEVFRSRKPLRLETLDHDPRATEEPLRDVGAKNGICVPLLVQIRDEENRVIDSKAIGVLWVMNRRGEGGFSEDDERLLTVFARQVAAVVSNAKYIEDLERQNQTLVNTLENLPAGILFIASDERIQLINNTARRLFGIADGRGVGEAYYRLIDHHGTCEVLGATMRDDEDKVAEVAFEIDSEERVFQIQAARVRGGDDSLNGVVAIFDDVTDVHHFDRLKQEFVQTFSAELIGPLTSIQGFSTMMRRDLSQPEDGTAIITELGGDVLDLVIGECQKLRRHIQDLLHVSRFEQGIRVHLSLTRCDLGELVQHLITHEAALTRRFQFDVQVPAEPLAITIDEARIEEVVYNLINNAVKYSPDGGAVTVKVSAVAEGARVEVTDQGVGIAADQINQLFQKFTRLQPTDGRVRAGRGIGLFVSRVFVEAHGGTIGLTSEPGSGSTFWFTLPLKPPTTAQIEG